jgi:hypothetical protein
MSSIAERQEARKAYVGPVIKDHGSLAALTADFDVNFVGTVGKLITMAAVSAPGGGGGGGQDPGTGGGGPVPPEPGQGGGGGGQGPGDGGGQRPGDGGGQPPDSGNNGGGGVRGDGQEGGDPGPGPAPAPFEEGGVLDDTSFKAPGEVGGIPTERLGPEGFEKLPFTGYPAFLAAFLGASLTTAGLAARSKLQQRRKP